MPEIPAGPLWANILAFLVAAAAIGWVGSRLAELADKLADRTGLGEAVTGTLFLGLITALPGLRPLSRPLSRAMQRWPSAMPSAALPSRRSFWPSLLLGLLYRQRAGPANIGFESALMLVLYLGGYLVLSLAM